MGGHRAAGPARAPGSGHPVRAARFGLSLSERRVSGEDVELCRPGAAARSDGLLDGGAPAAERTRIAAAARAQAGGGAPEEAALALGVLPIPDVGLDRDPPLAPQPLMYGFPSAVDVDGSNRNRGREYPRF